MTPNWSASREERLRRMLLATSDEIRASEQYGNGRDLWLAKVHPMPWTAGWEHESMCEIRDANKDLVATLNTGFMSYGYAGDIATLFLMALKDVLDAAHPS